MKLTNIRDYQGKKLKPETLEFIANRLVVLLNEAGFITDCTVVNSSRIDLSYQKKSFVIDTARIGYNARLNPHMNYKKGYARTQIPTWSQRVEYNNIINEHLDLLKVSCNIKSMHYIIRQGNEAMTERDWEDQKTTWEYLNEDKGFKVVSLESVA